MIGSVPSERGGKQARELVAGHIGGGEQLAELELPEGVPQRRLRRTWWALAHCDCTAYFTLRIVIAAAVALEK